MRERGKGGGGEGREGEGNVVEGCGREGESVCACETERRGRSGELEI